MSKSSKRWLRSHERDPFVKKARRAEFRSRAAYKLMEIDRKDRLFKAGQVVFDLGAAPGSWSQYAAQRVGPSGKVLAVDILPLQPLPGVTVIQGDFSEVAVLERCLALLEGRRVDLVISDMAPNLSGVRVTDQVRSMHLAELALDFADRTLAAGGSLFLKLFQGAGVEQFRRELSARFQRVMVRKPEASRDASREYYVLARGYKV